MRPLVAPGLRRRCTAATLLLWLGAGAAFAQTPTDAASHWAYQKPTRPTVPDGAPAAWQRHPIDAFTWRRMAQRSLGPQAQAMPARLLRRLHLDLVGLPPTVDEVLAFERDPSDEAYLRIVDDLLARPQFGEHWARQWLDLARYADSNGFQADQLRDSWAYRDWVIEALNQDMPFDRFTIEQLAGDLLPNATLEQKIATGFHRTVTCNVEAGVHPEANRVNQVVDRVNTTATVWLGTTMECAQCHAHKYDPFSQREYYGLFAFFNSTPIEVENPLGDKGVRYDFCGPWMDLPLSEEQQQRHADLQAERARVQAQHDAARAAAVESQPGWERDLEARLASRPEFAVLDVADFASTGGEDHQRLDDGSVLVSGRVPDTTTYTVRVRAPKAPIRALRLETLTHPSLPGNGPGRGDVKRPNFILSELQVAVGGRGLRLQSAHADHEQRGWPVKNATDGKQRTGWAIGGQFGKDHAATFVLREPLELADGEELVVTLDQRFGRGRTIGRLRLSAYAGDPDLLTLPADVARILREQAPTAKQRARLRRHYVASRPEVAKLARRRADLDKQLQAIEPDRTLVMVELDAPRETRLMQRGDYLRPGERVAPGTPAVLHPFDDALPKNRLGLARWLVSPDNPLVARVTVNRWWAHVFGRGLVATQEDFGLRGDRPSHPDLLDWLAVELVASGWSRKHLLRCIVTSETYRQSARRRPDDPDPDNIWLARGPRFRMHAEMIRDSALSAAGLLSLEAGGPPVFPPQPPGLWRQTGRNEPKYRVATDRDRFRRGVYVIWRRAAPYPSFVLFDGPDRATCHPMRSRTNTPMQALTLQNDEAYVEAALGLARRVLREQAGQPDEAAVERAFRLVAARRPTAFEARHLIRLLAAERARLTAAPATVDALLQGLPNVDVRGLDRTEVAAWFHVATVLLNLDEVITKG